MSCEDDQCFKAEAERPAHPLNSICSTEDTAFPFSGKALIVWTCWQTTYEITQESTRAKQIEIELGLQSMASLPPVVETVFIMSARNSLQSCRSW